MRARGAAEQSHPRGAEPQGAQDSRDGDVPQARHLHAEHLGRIRQRAPPRFLDEPLALFAAMKDHHLIRGAVCRRQQPGELREQRLRRRLREPQGRRRARRTARPASLARQMVHLDAQRVGRVAPDCFVWAGRDARPAGLPARSAAGADVGIVGHVHGLQEVAGQVVDARGKLAEVSRIRAVEGMVTGACGAWGQVGIKDHHLIDHELLLPGAVRQADDSAEIPQPAGHAEQLASVDPPRRERLNVRRMRTQHKNWLAGTAQPAREVAGPRLVGDDENASVAAQRQVAGLCLHLRCLQRPAQQASGLVMRLLRLGMHRETGGFEIDNVRLGTRTHGRAEGVFKPGR